jgi:prepilin-type N-terminal cleavage/methylation domain-containing protein
MKKTTKQQGFTIIELLVATTIFSIVLMVILASFLQVGRMFYKGISVNNTNEAARSLIDSITSDIKLAQTTTPTTAFPAGGTTAYYFCVGLDRYVYISDYHKINSDDINSPNPSQPHGVIRSLLTNGCQAPSAEVGTKVEQLLGPNMQLNLDSSKNGTDFIECDVGTGFCNVHAHVVFYGIDNTVFQSNNNTYNASNAYQAPDAFCSGSLLDTQLCAVTDIKAKAGLRK